MYIQNRSLKTYVICGITFTKKEAVELTKKELDALGKYQNIGLFKRLIDEGVFIKLTEEEVKALKKIKNKPSQEPKEVNNPITNGKNPTRKTIAEQQREGINAKDPSRKITKK